MHSLKKLAASIMFAALSLPSFATPYDVSLPRNAVPPNVVSTPNKPMMMLATSKDHTLFGPIYNDFEDLEGDGKIDTTFKPTFKYYGYFDATKCYTYDSGGLFIPSGMATLTGDKRYTCGGGGEWSGNFLNWATMTRMDVVRKMLYGGKRSTDTAQATVAGGQVTAVTNSKTILERANLSQDSHSFVKYYAGTDIADYTPFTVASLTKSTGANANKYAGLSICSRSDGNSNGGVVPQIRMAKGNYLLWATIAGRVCRWADEGPANFTAKSARYYKDVDKGNGVISHEVNRPDRSVDGAQYGTFGSELTVRVEVCKATLLGEERCQAYPPQLKENYKPYGIFQEFSMPQDASSAARVEFGVISGSYDKNLTAGALRKNMGDFLDEINPVTGVFCHSTGATGCAAQLAAPDNRKTGEGAIKAIDAALLYGANGNYGGSGTFSEGMTNGGLPAWGNPIGEMLVQTYQYYAGVTSTNPTSTTKDAAIGLLQQAWADPMSTTNPTRTNLYGNPICRPMYAMALSSSALSFDGMDGTSAGDGEITTLFNSLPNSAKSINQFTDDIGAAENINGTLRSVGSVAATWGDTCSAKLVTTLSKVSGVCPEGPAIGGTYKVAGAALSANTSKIRNVATLPVDIAKVQDALKVKTLTASLAGGSARVEVPIPGKSGQFVYITPEGLWNGGRNTGKPMPGAILTFNSISAGLTAAGNPYGAFMVTWNDTQFGGDYDMDIVGFLRYEVYADSASSSGYSIKITTDITDAEAGWTGLHGFSIIGTDKDQRYLTHMHNSGNQGPFAGTEGFLCGDAAYKSANPNACDGNATAGNAVDSPVTLSFQMKGASAVTLNDPLWYAAKYGYFPSSVKAANDTYIDVSMPPNQDAWDHYRADGSVGQDGVPDGYFLARRPDILEQQLRRALTGLADSANAAPATSSAQLLADGYKYTVGFSTESVTGELEAYQADADGNFGTSPVWNAGTRLRTDWSSNFASRKVITNSGNGSGAGMEFSWGSLDAAYKTQMTTNSNNVMSVANAQIVLNYVRGDQSLEGANGLRDRGANLLGPIVNAEPWVQRRPEALISGDGYNTFFASKAGRESMLWAAANDGMLHAFDPNDGGKEKFAYVPGAIANRLAEIPLQRGGPAGARTQLNGTNFVSGTSESKPTGTVWPYVDSSPFTADVKIGANWRTYLFGALGRGGRAIYALDVTDPENLDQASASDVFKWQFTYDDDKDASGNVVGDLGYVSMGKVLRHANSNQAMPIVKMNNGKYAMLVGNGQKSSTGKAVLFILFMDGPNGADWTGRFVKIVADRGNDNGLAMPNWEDFDGDGTADVIYAGDLQGNMWKFDVQSANEADWKVAFNNPGDWPKKPLYRATYVNPTTGVVTGLPITTIPQLVYRGQGGLTVNFGTGNAFEDANFPNSEVPQRFYGIWDRPKLGTPGNRALPTGLATLKQRTYVRDASTGYITLDSATNANVDYATQDGWYASMPASSEMVLSNPELSAGVIAFTSVRPKSNALNYCSTSPDASLYTVDPLSGRADRQTQGTMGSGATATNIIGGNIGDQIVRVVNDRTKKPFNRKCVAGEAGCTCVGTDCTKPATCGPGQSAKRVVGKKADATICYSTAPRVQWREIPGLRTDQ